MKDEYKDLEAQTTFTLENKDGIKVVFNKGDVLESEIYLKEYNINDLLEAVGDGRFTALDEIAEPETPANTPPNQYHMHSTMQLADKITLIGELEHLRRHCIRSAHTAENEDRKFYYQIKSFQLQELRRKLQHKWLESDELDWCIIKSASRLKQLNEEVIKDDLISYSEIEDIADDLLSRALGEDMTGCRSCLDDKQLEEAKRQANETIKTVLEMN